MLDLLDYRRTVFDLYHRIRSSGTDNPEAYRLWVETRDHLFAEHPQSALLAQDRADFKGLPYRAYDPGYRVVSKLDTGVDPVEYVISAGDDGTVSISLIARVSFQLPTGEGTLGVFWIKGYGGGIFIPFKDTTNGDETYGGGRYLYDTIKGADLGSEGNKLVLDFNYSYHPSCKYNPRWVCPLAPQENRLNFPVYAGEKL